MENELDNAATLYPVKFLQNSMPPVYHVQSWLLRLDALLCSYIIWIQQMAYAMGHKWFSHAFILMYWNIVFSVATMQARLSSSHVSQSMPIQLSSLLHFHIANFQSGWLLQWQSISLKASQLPMLDWICILQFFHIDNSMWHLATALWDNRFEFSFHLQKSIQILWILYILRLYYTYNIYFFLT